MDAVQLGFVFATLGVAALPYADPEARRLPEARASVALVLLAVLASFETLRGHVGALAAVLYLLGVLWLGWRALLRAAGRARVPASEKALFGAHVFLVGGAVWLFAYASRVPLLGFVDAWALLTAAHFHAAGFGALAFTALVHRATGRAGLLLVLHPMAFTLVAIGLSGTPHVDRIGVTVYVAVFLVQVRAVRRARLAAPIWFAAIVPLPAIALAVAWAWGSRALALESMASTHGAANALGHVLLGLVGFARTDVHPSVPPLQVPLSRLRARFRVGADFLARFAPRVPAEHAGISDDLRAYTRSDFDPAALDPQIRRFYERTSDYELEVVPRWGPGFRLAGRLWSACAARLGQLGLPAPDRGPESMDSRFLDIDDHLDGRRGVRGWVRLWSRTRRPVYVATYAESVASNGARVMNIAFPLPGCNMTSLLHLEHDGDRGLKLTSLGGGDQGVYLVWRGRPLRLPLDETIRVHPSAGGQELSAVHEMWFCGLPSLTLRYRIWRRQPSRP